MPNIHKLTPQEARSLQHFAHANNAELRLNLLRMVASARVRLANAVSASLDPSRRAHARRLAALARRMASGYARLQHLPGAIRHSRRLADVAAKRAGLHPEKQP